jgi:plasmid stabilization system protein ParE
MGNKKKTIATAYEVTISNNAVLNIDEVTGYIAFVNHQPLNAIKVGDAIFDTIERIQNNPYAFKECEEIPTKTKMYRKATCHSWTYYL